MSMGQKLPLIRNLPPALSRTRLCTFAVLAGVLLLGRPLAARAQSCTSQSELSEADRNALAGAARTFAEKIQANDAAYLKTVSAAEIQKDFGGLQYLVSVTSPKLAGSAVIVDQVYLLDASTLKPAPNGSAPEAQFYCPLNHGALEADFDIPALPPGRYAFAIVNLMPAAGAAAPVAPYRLSMLLRQEPANQPQRRWLLAGLYPKPLTEGGHDGLWYWVQARQLVKQKQPINAWLYYQTAAQLLRPADFVVSSHLDKLRSETTDATPPALSEGVTPSAPLVVKSASGVEYHFIGLSVADAPEGARLDLAVHLRAEPAADEAAATARDTDAAKALLAAYPELRRPFHGVRIFADVPGQPSVSTELSMAQLQ